MLRVSFPDSTGIQTYWFPSSSSITNPSSTLTSSSTGVKPSGIYGLFEEISGISVTSIDKLSDSPFTQFAVNLYFPFSSTS